MTHPSWHNYLKPDENEALASFELEITRLRKDAAANSRWRKMIMDRAMARERAALKLERRNDSLVDTSLDHPRIGFGWGFDCCCFIRWRER